MLIHRMNRWMLIMLSYELRVNYELKKSCTILDGWNRIKWDKPPINWRRISSIHRTVSRILKVSSTSGFGLHWVSRLEDTATVAASSPQATTNRLQGCTVGAIVGYPEDGIVPKNLNCFKKNRQWKKKEFCIRSMFYSILFTFGWWSIFNHSGRISGPRASAATKASGFLGRLLSRFTSDKSSRHPYPVC